MDSRIAVDNDVKRAPRSKTKRVLLIVMIVILVLAGLVLYAFYWFYRDMHDDTLMEEIRREMAASQNIEPDNRVNETDPVQENNDQQIMTQLADHPLMAFLGMKEAEVVTRFGEPEETGFWKGANYYSYSDSQNMLFFFANDLPGVVVGLSYFGPERIAGTGVGMTMDEIKSVWGEPDSKYYDEEYTPPDYSYYYRFPGMGLQGTSGRNDLEIVFSGSSEQGPVNYIDIFCK